MRYVALDVWGFPKGPPQPSIEMALHYYPNAMQVYDKVEEEAVWQSVEYNFAVGRLNIFFSPPSKKETGT